MKYMAYVDMVVPDLQNVLKRGLSREREGSKSGSGLSSIGLSPV